MAKDFTKLIDSNTGISTMGRADQYAMLHGYKPKHAMNVVGGADNGIDQFDVIKRFRLKGFEYGNWVSNSDRYDNLIAAQRSLQHLAQIIGSDNIGINGNVGVAFGARGYGGSAVAHYEAQYNMINLSKTNGAGSLAHEYGHALDYNFGSFVDQHKSYAALSGGYSTAQTLEANTGGQLRAMVNRLVDAVIRTDSHQAIRKKGNEYWIRRTEIFARCYEQYICYKMRKISTDKYLTETWDHYCNSKAYLTEAEFLTILPIADKLNAEIAKFLKGRGKLKATPYPAIGKKAKPVKIAAHTKAAPAKPAPVKKAAAPKPLPQPKPTTLKATGTNTASAPSSRYYGIDEKLARTAKEMRSWDDYKAGSATAEYRSSVDAAYAFAGKWDAEHRAEAYRLADRYAKRLAAFSNKNNHISTLCPSIMISGAGNFPVRKKERQQKMWAANYTYYQEKVEPLLKRLQDGPRMPNKRVVKSGDDDAIAKLETKVAKLQKSQDTMKQVNAYYRKHKTLDGCTLISSQAAAECMETMRRYGHAPFESFKLSNNLAEIKRCEARIAQLKRAKAEGNHEKDGLQNKYFRVVANSDIMRLQLFFDGIPETQQRDIIKKHGFKWSPANKAWQRVLNANATYATKRIIEEFDKL